MGSLVGGVLWADWLHCCRGWMYTQRWCLLCLFCECSQVLSRFSWVRRTACGEVLEPSGPHSFSESFELQIFDQSFWWFESLVKEGSLHLEMPCMVLDLLPPWYNCWVNLFWGAISLLVASCQSCVPNPQRSCDSQPCVLILGRTTWNSMTDKAGRVKQVPLSNENEAWCQLDTRQSLQSKNLAQLFQLS